MQLISALVLSGLVLLTAFDLAVGLILLLRGTRDGLTLARVVGALVVVVSIACVEVIGVMVIKRDFFLAVNTAYWDTFIVVPACAGAMIVGRWQVMSAAVKGIAVGGLALIPLGIYATFIEPLRLTVETPRAVLSRAPAQPLRVAILADLQFRKVTAREHEAIARAMDFDPHLVLLPGDLLQASARQYAEHAADVPALLAPLQAPLGVYFVQGNLEPGARERIERLLAGTSVHYLLNEVVELQHEGTAITLGGVDLDFRGRQADAVFERLERSGGNDLRILLAHRPDAVYRLERATRVDLVVAGHTHGGQVNVPLLGTPITLSAVPSSVAAGGLHELEGTHIYVSRGVGCERGNAPRVRFNAVPEVTWLTIVGPRTAARDAPSPERSAPR